MTQPNLQNGPGKQRMRLTLLSGPNAGYSMEFRQASLSIGREDTNDLVLPGPYVSMKHAEILSVDHGYLYRDLKSKNGTMLLRDDKRIVLNERTRYQTELFSGDTIVLGDSARPVLIRFERFESASIEIRDGTVAASCRLENVRDIRDFLLQDRGVLSRMYQFLEDLQPLFNAGELFRKTADLLRTHFPQATSIGVFLRDPADDRFTSFPLHEGGDPTGATPQLSRTLQNEILSTMRSLLVEDAVEAYPDAHSLAGTGIRSILCAPLWTQERISGILQLATDNRELPFSRTDLELVTVFAHQVALVFEKIRLHELLRESEDRTRQENLYLSRLVDEKYRFENIIGTSAAMQQVFSRMKNAAAHDLPVLIIGETGTGKELVARAIHQNSRRLRKRFVAVNCGAISEALIESELFGHVRGAFTGATADKKGLMEEADGGTAFLDEIGETPLSIQIKLLRFLQDGEVRPVGATRSRTLSVRILAAAQSKIEDRIREGRFREDLFYRLNFFTLELPPLRERREDIPLLAQYWLNRYACDMGKPVKFIQPEALRRLQSHPFPGNVRELQNMIAQAVAIAKGDTLLEGDIPLCRQQPALEHAFPARPAPGSVQELREAKQKAQDEIEKAFLQNVLERCDGNVSRAAREIGINRSTLHEMMTRHNILRNR